MLALGKRWNFRSIHSETLAAPKTYLMGERCTQAICQQKQSLTSRLTRMFGNTWLKRKGSKFVDKRRFIGQFEKLWKKGLKHFAS